MSAIAGTFCVQKMLPYPFALPLGATAADMGLSRRAEALLAEPLGSSRLDPSTARGASVTNPEDLVGSALAILADRDLVPSPGPRTQPAPLGLDAACPAQPPQSPGPNTLPLQERILSDGSRCPLPIRYFDAQLLIATYLVEYGRAAALLKATGLTAVPQPGDKAIAAFGCFEYRRTDIGPYNEIGLTILAMAPKYPMPALYVVHLPVNTALTNRAGREIWGYNKFVATIVIAGKSEHFSMTIRDPDSATIARFGGTRGASVSMPPTDLVTFSLLDGQLLRTTIQAMTPSQLSGGSGFSLQIGESMHAMAQSLRTLGLDGINPVLVQYADPFQSLLFPGQIT
jgi:hypothetical protein